MKCRADADANNERRNEHVREIPTRRALGHLL